MKKENIKLRKHKTKYPVILVHGINTTDFLWKKSFGNIDSFLKTQGYDVYKSKVEGFGTMTTNAKILKREVEKILEETGASKINIIGHSKGGLDAKRMIEKYNMEDEVASLTTLCTPHKGTIVATRLLKLPKPIIWIVSKYLNLKYRIMGDKKPNSLAVCKELAEHKNIDVDHFDLSKKIYCQSYSCVMTHAKDDFIMSVPYIIHNKIRNIDSDGVVEPESTKFGNYRGNIAHDLSHTQMIDYMTTRRQKVKVYAFYASLLRDLARKGF